jgi:hypothetical protein
VVLETAQPCKFDNVIAGVIGKPAPRPKGFDDMEKREVFFTEIAPSGEAVMDFIQKKAI